MSVESSMTIHVIVDSPNISFTLFILSLVLFLSVIVIWYVSIAAPFLLALVITTSESANKLIAKCLLRSKWVAFTVWIAGCAAEK